MRRTWNSRNFVSGYFHIHRIFGDLGGVYLVVNNLKGDTHVSEWNSKSTSEGLIDFIMKSQLELWWRYLWKSTQRVTCDMYIHASLSYCMYIEFQGLDIESMECSKVLVSGTTWYIRIYTIIIVKFKVVESFYMTWNSENKKEDIWVKNHLDSLANKHLQAVGICPFCYEVVIW